MNESTLELECFSENNLDPLTGLTLELWPDCNYAEEFSNWKKLLYAPDNYCVLAKNLDQYAGFIHLSIRKDYVEGSITDKTVCLEAIYIKPEYRQHNIAKLLLNKSEDWAISKGFNQIATDTEVDNLISQKFLHQLNFKEVNRIVCYVKDL